MNKKFIADSYTGRSIIHEGTEYIQFAGTGYLGINKNYAFKDLLLQGFDLYGTNFGSSRNGNIVLPVYQQAENMMANWVGTESALTVSSGMLAGRLLVEAFENYSHKFYAPGLHPALLPADTQLPDLAYDDWTINTITSIDDLRTDELILIFISTIDILKGKKYELNWLKQLPESKNILLVLDDSHGFGVLGENGNGVWDELSPVDGIQKVMISSLGKALGIPGGTVAGPQWVIEKIKGLGMFNGSSPVPPAFLHAFTEAKKIYDDERSILWQRIEYLKNKIRDISDNVYHDGLPVFYLPGNSSIYNELIEKQILLSSFPYPTPQSEHITRIVVNSLHTLHDLDLLSEALMMHFQFQKFNVS